ncbi:MAG: epoxide hydrolase [Polyangiaceae bacterium]
MDLDVEQPAPEKTAIRSFQADVPEAELAELRRRISQTRWPERKTVTDQSHGVPLELLHELARYWVTEYDWRWGEAKLNALPQFVTEIDGLDIHFVHISSMHENALPLIVSHGWPGSVIEQLRIVDPLINPTEHGASAAQAFDLVIPSLPGHGFSGTPTGSGWGPARIARAWVVLMKRLGYTRFVAQGADWAALVTEQMRVQAPPELLGVHSKHTPQVLASCSQALTVSADSPIDLAAFLLEQDARRLQLSSRAFAGGSEGLTRDDVLDNITLYWLTNTALSAARLRRDTRAEGACPRLAQSNALAEGGLFAPWEQPEVFARELRAAFESLRPAASLGARE